MEVLLNGYSQCPTASFSVTSPACQGENITLINNTVNATMYEWDFCPGDLESTPTAVSVLTDSNLAGAFDIELKEDDGNYYGFVVGSSSRNLIRIEFGNHLENTPTISNLGNPGSLLTNPDDISLIKENNDWYGLVANGSGNNLIRLDFGNSLSNSPTATDLGGFGIFATPFTVEVVEDDGDVFAMLASASSSEVYSVNFGNSITNTPTGTELTFSGASGIRGFDVIEECGNWYGLIGSFSNNKVIKLDFGNSLENSPTVTEETVLTYTQPTGTALVAEGGQFYGIVQARGGDLYFLDYGASLSSSPSGVNLGDLGVLTSVHNPFAVISDSSTWYGFTIDFSSSTLFRIDWPNACQASSPISTEEVPGGINYGTDGTNTIVLRATDSNGNDHYTTETITVSTDVAPDIDFSVDASRCILNSNTFTSINTSGDIQTYSWDFGDTNTSNVANPTHQYGSSGTYEITLSVVSTSGCTNSVSKEFTWYADAPSPAFSVPGGSLCTNSSLSFTNDTDLTGFDESDVTWSWDFNGEGISSEKDPSFTFSSSGTKTITLQAHIPGCSSTVLEQDIVLGEGSSVSFTYTNNCFSEPISFTSVTSGTITDYVWDFGDTNGSTNANPTHTYAAAGMYTVELTVTNDVGCVTSFSQDIEVTDGDLADFTFPSFEENIAGQFDGMDLTISDDAVTGWSWDFDGLGNSTDEDPFFTFPSAGTYSVSLEVTTSQGCTFTVMKDVSVDASVCPTGSFSLPTDVCQGEQFNVTNTSVNATSYYWDFCSGDMLTTPSASSILTDSNFDGALGHTIVEDGGQFYGFTVGSSSANVIRFDFGSDLTSTPTIVNLGNPGSLLTNPDGIGMIRESGNWYGLVVNGSGDNVIRLDFGSDISSSPTAEDLGGFGIMDTPFTIDIAIDDGDYFAVIGSGSQTEIYTLDFGNSITNSPTATELLLTGPSGIRGLSVIEECGNWYGMIGSFSNDRVVKLDFGTSLNNAPTETDETVIAFADPTNTQLINEGGNYYALIQSRTGSVYRLNYNGSLSNAPTGEDLGNLGVLATGHNAFAVVEHESIWYGFTIDFGTTSLFRIDFSPACSGASASSNLETPAANSYASDGSYTVTLRSTDSNGNDHYTTETITVSTDVAPDIDFSIDVSRCISNSNTFTPNISGLTYSWDFDLDGIEDSNLENPNFQFPTTGTHTVRLDVTDGTCTNFVEQEITIYSDPPAPTFTAASSACRNADIFFANTTDESQHAEVITYEWDFDGELITEKSPTFNFATSGTKQITLKSIIPGCENTSTAFEIEIFEGPSSAFSSSSLSICEGETISLADQSTNGALEWEWDFDDGFTSNAQNPDHLFSEAGNYSVILTVTDMNGCRSTSSQEVSVASLPIVTFDFVEACTSSDGVQFMDLSTVNGADIVSRTWYVGDVPLAEVQDEQNPILYFPGEGITNVRLEAMSSSGCSSSHSEDIQILPAPEPDFSVNIGCEGEESLFSGFSASPGNQITSWFWTIDGEEYLGQDVGHTFNGSGMFDVTLEVTGQNFCSETITRSVEVLELLSVEFEVNGDCSNELIELSDLSVPLKDPIVSRQWSLDGTSVGNGSELVLESLPEDTYELTLEVTTLSGCVVNASENILINRAPQAGISAPKTFGIPGEAVIFTNVSTGGSSHHWLFNGDSVSDNEAEETFVFDEPGRYDIGLVANNDLGCSDTTTTSVLIATPIVDLSIGQFELVENNNIGTIFLEIQNNSNLPIDNTEVVIELENQFSVTEQISTLIDIGASQLVNLNVGVPLSATELSYLCVSLNSQYKGFEDSNPLDNEKCLTIEPEIIVEAPFPNPVRDQVRVRLVAPNGGKTTITLLNSAGKVELRTQPETEEGLNNFFLDLKGLTTGVYFIRMEIEGIISVQRIVKL